MPLLFAFLFALAPRALAEGGDEGAGDQSIEDGVGDWMQKIDTSSWDEVLAELPDEVSWVIGDTDAAGLIRRGQVFDKTLYTLMIGLFLLSCCAVLLRKNARKPFAVLLILIFCANFCAYLLIEVGARYRYFIMPFVFALSAVAIERLDAFCYARLRPRFAKDGKAKAARAEL